MWKKLLLTLSLFAAALSLAAQGDGKVPLTVTATPWDARITVGGKTMTGTWRGRLPHGKYNIVATRSGYQRGTRSVTLTKGKPQNISITLKKDDPKPTPPQDERATLSIESETRGASIYVDNDWKGSSSWSGKLAAGTHTIRVTLSGYKSKETSIRLQKGKEQSIYITALEKEERPVTPTPTPSPSTTVRKQTYTAAGVSFTMVRVEGGTFTMGANAGDSDADDDEKPRHRVTLSSYWIGETEVTQALWQAVMGSNPSNFKGVNRPVETVSWDDCQAFLRRLNSLTGETFCLPTEAEWEFAARGGNASRGYKYSGSNSIDAVAWYNNNSNGETHPVGQKQANELGLYDMSGNVWEWCADWYGSYSSSSQTNPTGPSSASYRVKRGGGWYYIARRCRVSYRYFNSPSYRFNGLGLRLSIRNSK